jgi:predicted transcriptional regulator
MARQGLHRLVVVASDGRVTGILTPLDVLRWLAGFDGYVLAKPDVRAQR